MRHQKKALVEQIRNRQIRYDRRKKNESRKQRQNKVVGERRSHLQTVVARDVSVRPPQSAFYLWQRHAVCWMRLRRYAGVREVKDPEREVKSIAGVRPLCAEGTTAKFSLLCSRIGRVRGGPCERRA